MTSKSPILQLSHFTFQVSDDFLNQGNNFDFQKNFNSFKSILSIPKLTELDIKQNTLGKKGLKYLCEFLENNTTLEYLSFIGIFFEIIT
jgi:Ran GTPase-activating protein (RanGAP) involved in mRNA processing and transport